MSELKPNVELEKITVSQEMAALNDQDLINACKSGSREAWNEFFTRFGHLMREAIVRVIRRRAGNNTFVPEEDDTVSDIRVKIVKKLYIDGGLAECRDTRGIRPWLRTVATNQARDWFRGMETEENLPKTEAEKEAVTLDDTISDDSETTRGEVTEDCGSITCEKIGNAEEIMMAVEENETLVDLLPALTRMQEFRNSWMTRLVHLATKPLSKGEIEDLAGFCRITLDAVSEDIERITAKIVIDQRKYWILRLSILAMEPLTPQETEELAGFSRIPVDAVGEQIEEVSAILERKREEKETELGKAELYRHQLIRLERRRYEAARKGAEADIERLEEEIIAKSSKRLELIRKGSKVPRPSNKDIAQLVGLPEDQEGQVTTILSRVQDRIWQGWKQALRDRDRGKTDIDLTDYLYL